MKVRKAMAIVLACTMLMGQTVWAQEVQAESETQNNEEVQVDSLQEDSEQEVQQTDENAEVIVEEEVDLEESMDETTEEDAAAEKEIAEKSVYTDVATGEKTICVNYPIMVDASYTYSGDSVYSVESADESICKVTGGTYEERDYNWMYFILDGVSPGKTMISLKLNGSVVKQYEVTVNELPDDAVMFNNVALRTVLSADGIYDLNNDHCINQSEMEKITGLSYCFDRGMYLDYPLQDLSGLEYATNLKYIDLSGNTELTDISVLFQLNFLQSVDLRETNVSDEDRWRLADFKDDSIVKGEAIFLPSLVNIFEEGLEIEIISGNEYVEIIQYGNTCYLVGKEAGEAELRISYNSCSAEITMVTQGIPSNQEVGENYDVEIFVPNTNIFINTNKSLIIDSNNQLWQTYPIGKKIASGVKEYVAGWVYYGDDNSAEEYAYTLDTSNILWNGNTKLAEDVVKFDGRYVLDSNGVLKNIYNSSSEQIEQVEDWISPILGGKGIAYILKKDGTLWKRQEVAADQTLLGWELADSNVQQILRGKYLKQDGTVVMYDGTEVNMDVKVSKICSDGTYYDSEGDYYCYAYYYGTNSTTGEYEYISGYRNIGKLDIKSQYAVNGANYLLTQDNEVYKYDVKANETTFYMSDVAQMRNPNADSDEWVFLLSDGTYCDLAGTPMSEVIIATEGIYKLIWHEDGTKMIEKNGVAILDCVMDLWSDYRDGKYICFALRTDGTVWNITGIPEQVLDLNQTEEEIKGDLNGDSEINLLDLMQCLNHVSKKSLLEGSTYAAADIDGNGTVDLLDLMRILNYVSKKTDTL